MIINGIDYPVIKKVRIKELGEKEIPLLDVPMMLDDRWQELANTPEQIEYRRRLSLTKDGDQHG